MQLHAVVLSGGVFMNALLSSEANTRLQNDGFRVYRHRLVPPNDGGLSLGQLAIAAAQALGESAGEIGREREVPAVPR
jgi:hydrogenase maturation protein HypF